MPSLICNIQHCEKLGQKQNLTAHIEIYAIIVSTTFESAR